MSTKILKCTIHFAYGLKKRSAIRPKISIYKCFGNTRTRVHKTKSVNNIIRRPEWEDTFKVEYSMQTDCDATLVFQLTDIFHNKLAEATVPMIDITREVNRKSFPLISKGKTLGNLVLTISLNNDHDQAKDKPTTTSKKGTDDSDSFLWLDFIGNIAEIFSCILTSMSDDD